MNRPVAVILWHSQKAESTDDSGTAVTSSVGPPPAFFNQGAYKAISFDRSLRYVPSLSYFCIRALIESPEDVHYFGPPRLHCEAPTSTSAFNILRALIPSYDPVLTEEGRLVLAGFDIHDVDPRLWAILIQVFVRLPPALHVYPIALSDEYLHLLQRVPQTPHFSLLTVLDLRGCQHLTDNTIVHLQALHGLCAMDASETPLTDHAILRLSGTLKWSDDGDDPARRRRGPSGLRMLSLRGCRKLGNRAFDYLETFLLLSVVDLRGTNCTPNSPRLPKSFAPARDGRLFHPAPLLDTLSLLSSIDQVFSSSNPYVLHINRLHYGSIHTGRSNVGIRSTSKTSVAPEDAFVMLPPSHGSSSTDIGAFHRHGRVVVGNAVSQANREAQYEDMVRHELNKAAWYERHENDADIHVWNTNEDTENRGLSGEEYFSQEDEDEDEQEGEEFSDEEDPHNSYSRRLEPRPSTLPPQISPQRARPNREVPVASGSGPARHERQALINPATSAASAARSRPSPAVASGSEPPKQERQPPRRPPAPAAPALARPSVASVAPTTDRSFAGVGPRVADRTRPAPPARNSVALRAGAAHQRVGPHAQMLGLPTASALPLAAVRVPRQPILPRTVSQTPLPRNTLTAAVPRAAPPEIAFMNSIASAEVAAANSRRAAQAFYASHIPSTSTSSASSTVRPTPGGPLPHADTSAQQATDPLMLYRHPPPWSILQTPPPSCGPTSKLSKEDEPVATNRQDKKVQAQVRGMQDMLSKRQRTTWQADGFVTKGQLQASTSRNPFSTQRFAGKDPVNMKAIKERLGVASDMPAGRHTSGLPPPTLLKPLRPISSLDVPLLPSSAISTSEDIKKAVRRSGSLEPPSESEIDVVKKPRLSASTRSVTSGRPSSVKDGTKKLKPAESPALRKASTRLTSGPKPAVKTVTASPSEFKRPRTVTAPSAAQNKSFDWSQWAK